MCYRVRDTSSKWCCDQDWDEERWGFTRQKKRPSVQVTTALCIAFCLLRRALVLRRVLQSERHVNTAHLRWPESLFPTLTPLLFQNFWIRARLGVRHFFEFENPTPVQTPATIIEPTEIYPCYYLRKDHTLLILPKWKSDSRSGSGFSQVFDYGSERKTQNPAGVDSSNPGPVPPLVLISVENTKFRPPLLALFWSFSIIMADAAQVSNIMVNSGCKLWSHGHLPVIW